MNIYGLFLLFKCHLYCTKLMGKMTLLLLCLRGLDVVWGCSPAECRCEHKKSNRGVHFVSGIPNAGEKLGKGEVKVLNQMCLCLTACDYSGVCVGGGEVGVISVWGFSLFGHWGFSMSYLNGFVVVPEKKQTATLAQRWGCESWSGASQLST